VVEAQTGEVSLADLWRPRRYLLAWTAPLAVTAAVVGGTVLASGNSSGGHPSLPDTGPAQLLAKVETAKAPVLSGVVRQTAALGLPDLPGGDQSASLSWTSLLSGTHTARVWLDGARKQRVALLGTLSEADIIHNGRDIWTYTSSSNEVSHTVAPADKAAHDERAGDRYTPIAAAKALLKAVTPSTAVSVGQTQVVAGRDAYTLVIRPRDSRSTVREVQIAIDSTRFVPLRLQVFGSGSSPAFQIVFAMISFTTPSASIFNFHAPAGAAVVKNPMLGGDLPDHVAGPAPRSKVSTAPPKLLGSGWTTVVEFPSGLPGGQAGGLLNRLTQPTGTPGERLLTTALINGLLLPDGRVFIGAVTPSLLEHLAATTPR
jgi:outer membrane lipoprotein-sorting protein